MQCDEIIRMVLLAGLSDRDVKRELLADERLEKISVEQTILTVEIMEQALRSLNNMPAKVAGAETTKTGSKSDPRLKKKGELCSTECIYMLYLKVIVTLCSR